MSMVATTKMSSRGQVVIPEAVRNEMGLKPGDQFVVLAQDGAVILKGISKPSMKDFDALIRESAATGESGRSHTARTWRKRSPPPEAGK